MSNFHVRIAAEQWLPWARLEESEDHRLVLKGPMEEILGFIQRKLGFSYTLSRPDDRKWGLPIGNTTDFDGMMGMLQKNEVDIALGPFGLTQERHSTVVFSSILFLDFIAILSGHSEVEHREFKLLQIFDLKVWIATMISLVVLSLVASLMFSLSVSSADSFSGAILPYYAGFLGQSLAPKPGPSTSERVLLGSCIISTLFLRSYFNVQILSSLVAYSGKSTDTLEDVLDSGVQPMVEAGGAIESILQSSEEGSAFRKVWERIAERQGNSVTHNVIIDEDNLDKVLSKEKVIITERSTLLDAMSRRSWSGRKCGFYISKSYIGTLLLAMAYRRGLEANFLNALKNQTVRIMPSGLMKDWLLRATRNASRCLAQKPASESLSLEVFFWPFLSWGIGMGIAVLFFWKEFRSKSKSSKLSSNSCPVTPQPHEISTVSDKTEDTTTTTTKRRHYKEHQPSILDTISNVSMNFIEGTLVKR